MDATLTAEPRAAPALYSSPVEVRVDTLALCQQVREAEARHFPAWCLVIDNQRSRRSRELPSDVVELERDRLAELQAAVERLREHCMLDMHRAERECHALMRVQVERDLTATAALRVARGAQVREVIRSQTNGQRIAAYETRDALCCGRGWPHTGELVIATASIYDSTAQGGERVHEGACVYTGSHDTHNTSHTVQVPGLGEFHLAWEPHEHWGNANPNGDIKMRVATRPDQPLPCPLPRWPTSTASTSSPALPSASKCHSCSCPGNGVGTAIDRRCPCPRGTQSERRLTVPSTLTPVTDGRQPTRPGETGRAGDAKPAPPRAG